MIADVDRYITQDPDINAGVVLEVISEDYLLTLDYFQNYKKV